MSPNKVRPLESPLSVSSSGASVHRTLASLRGPVSGGWGMGKDPWIRSVAARQAAGTWSTGWQMVGVRPGLLRGPALPDLRGHGRASGEHQRRRVLVPEAGQLRGHRPAGLGGFSGRVSRGVRPVPAGRQPLSGRITDYSRLDGGQGGITRTSGGSPSTPPTSTVAGIPGSADRRVLSRAPAVFPAGVGTQPRHIGGA